MTGHCQSGGIEPDWQALAQANHTLAIYMGTTKAELISQRLIEQGRSPLTLLPSLVAVHAMINRS
ncbi:bifunctional uroporphyrin-III C-methyltransferase/sirohydrochlorin ferrochelatase [Proteus mirabilis]|uniref:Bifunctional uroporphyrin-III C-methyltransferase/sirohydrochlorin ferrochelatase n=1 Tax=Proteus mirabilis TaxID=584 RepID=A0A379GE39_PROMI|nr:bifunctional uroporphyrin-III C-methyltransferase/sirohydrochlorin ferrochelatase [Proteus mirabilis]